MVISQSLSSLKPNNRDSLILLTYPVNRSRTLSDLTTYSQLFAEEEIKKKVVKTAEESVPKQYHEFLNVFSKEASERLPERKPYDHAIELVPGYSMFHSKVYPLSNNEQEELDKFLKEQLAKGYIRESKSPISSPFFFIKKKEGTLRPVQDYR